MVRGKDWTLPFEIAHTSATHICYSTKLTAAACLDVRSWEATRGPIRNPVSYTHLTLPTIYSV